MAAGLAKLRGVFGGNETALEADLRRATESEVIEVPKELLLAIEHASHNEEDRRDIMRHLRGCLAEPSGKKWRRVYAGLVLVEDLIRKGSPDLWRETSEGRHFDVVQRVSLLEHFECTTDKRVQNMVRSKASGLRKELVPRLECACEDAPGLQGFGSKDTPSTGSPGPSSITSCTTSVGSSGGYVPSKPEGNMVLNGIVTVGHRDDTTSDESSGDEGTRKAVSYRKPKKGSRGSAKNQRHRSDESTDSDDDSRQRPKGGGGPAGARSTPPPPAPKPPQPAPTVDLLDL